MKEITIRLKDDTYEHLKELTELENLINRHRDKNRDDNYQIEDFVVGCIIDKMEQINHFRPINPLIEHGSQSVIKNRFKEIAKQKDIYIKDIAEQLDMKLLNVSKIVNNFTQRRLKLFIKIWMVLGCPPLHQCIYLEED